MASKYLDCIFLWGRYQASILCPRTHKHCRTVVSGNVRFDVLQSPNTSIYKNDCSRLRRQYGSFVLINTNFARGNLSASYGRPILEHLTSAGLLKTPEDASFYEESGIYKKVLLKKYIELVQTLSNTYQHINFVVRPHPSEERSTWVKALRRHRNVHICTNLSVAPWILASKAVNTVAVRQV